MGIGHSSKKTPTSLVWVSTILKMSVASGCRLKWSTSVGDIVKRTSTLINYARSVYDKVGSSKPDTFESVVLVNYNTGCIDMSLAYFYVRS